MKTRDKYLTGLFKITDFLWNLFGYHLGIMSTPHMQRRSVPTTVCHLMISYLLYRCSCHLSHPCGKKKNDKPQEFLLVCLNVTTYQVNLQFISSFIFICQFCFYTMGIKNPMLISLLILSDLKYYFHDPTTGSDTKSCSYQLFLLMLHFW